MPCYDAVMKVSVSSSPARLACWSGVGSVLTAIPFLIGTVFHVPRLPTPGCGPEMIFWADRLRFLVFLVPFACGITISILAEKRLRRGLKNETWQESVVELLRRRINHPVWSVFAYLPLLAWFGYAFQSKLFHGTPLFWFLMAPTQTISRLRMMLRPKQVAGDRVLPDWRNFKPIQSEHWGEPRQNSFSL